MEMCCYCGGGNLSAGAVAVDCEDTASYSIEKVDTVPYTDGKLIYALGQPGIPRDWLNLFSNSGEEACNSNWSYKFDVNGP